MFFDFKFGAMKIKVNDHLHLMENLVSISNFRIFIQLNLRVLIKHVLMVWMGCKKKMSLSTPYITPFGNMLFPSSIRPFQITLYLLPVVLM